MAALDTKRQTTEDRRQKAEDRGQKAEDRRQVKKSTKKRSFITKIVKNGTKVVKKVLCKHESSAVLQAAEEKNYLGGFLLKKKKNAGILGAVKA